MKPVDWRSAASALAVGWCVATAAAEPIEQPPTWASLSAVQQEALAPLRQEWSGVDRQRKEKWIEVSSHFSTLSAEERRRVQARMTSWLLLSPADRNRARLQFQEIKQVPADERQARWQAYQALSLEERHRLATDARPNQKPASAVDSRSARPPASASGAASRRTSAASSGSARTLQPAGNSPPNSAVAAPIALQARPGATTVTRTARPMPPLHHQTGMPKIATSPGFVDPNTLLPQRGPQGAAVRSATRPTPASPLPQSVAPSTAPVTAGSATGAGTEPPARQ